MSYIRPAQDGEYINIPSGSNYYLFGDGDNIGGWSHGQFAALIGTVVDEIDWTEQRDGVSTQSGGYITEKFEEHFGGWDESYEGGITPPERAEIFCQCVDRRVDSLELTEALHESVQEWANEFDAYRTCKFCGEEFRPYLYDDSTEYVCDDEQCEIKSDAEIFALTEDKAEKYREMVVDGFDSAWEYLEQHSEKEEYGQ